LYDLLTLDPAAQDLAAEVQVEEVVPFDSGCPEIPQLLGLVVPGLHLHLWREHNH
jgi:hypothetical protein